MKNFVKAMDRESSGFAFLQEKLPRMNMEKLKSGIFDGLQMRELMKNLMFDEVLSEAELSAWQSLKSVVTNLLGNQWSAGNQWEISGVRNTRKKQLKSYRQLGAFSAVTLGQFSKELRRF